MAGSTSRPAPLFLYRFCRRPGGLSAAIPEGVLRAIARASGHPGSPASDPRPRSQYCGPRARRSGCGVRGVLNSWLPAAGPGDCVQQSSPRSAASPLRVGWSTPQWASESVCLYRKLLGDSSSWMRGSTCRPAPLGGLSAAIPGGELRAIARASGCALCPAWRRRPGPSEGVRVRVALRRRGRKSYRLPSQFQRPVPVQPKVPKPPRCASTPPRLIGYTRNVKL
jgi:hypothetical protein